MRIGSLHGVVVEMHFWGVCPTQDTYPQGRRVGGTKSSATGLRLEILLLEAVGMCHCPGNSS